MNIAQRLAYVRDAFADCEMVAYADISTKMVLAHSGAAKMRQEHLDALCDKAADMFGMTTTKQLGAVLGQGGFEDAGAFQVIVMDNKEVGVFLRSTITKADALCCVCTPGIDLTAFIPAARAQLEEIGKDT